MATLEGALLRDSDHESRQRDERAGKKRVDENDREWNTRLSEVRHRQGNDADQSRDDSSTQCRDCNRLELTDAGVSPQATVHTGRIEDRKPKRDRYYEVERNEPKIFAYPACVFEPYEECDKRRQNDRERVGDEEVPVTE